MVSQIQHKKRGGKINKKISTRERLENAIKHQPDRYIVRRDKKTNELIEVQDKDTGYLWKRFFKDGKEYWAWVS